MDFKKILESASGIMGGITGAVGGGEKKKKGDPIEDEMRLGYKKKFAYDDKNVNEVVSGVAKRSGVNPAMLFTSSFQEGMNKQIFKREETEKNLKDKGWFNEQFPVSGYDFYGLDTFGDKFEGLVKKGYLTEDFNKNFSKVQIENDHMKKDPKTGKMIPDPQLVTSADFKTNESALMAKAAMLRDIQDTVGSLAKDRGIELDEDAANYFTLVGYNAGEENAGKMLDKYASAKDKKSFIEKGDANWQSVHKNVSPRMSRMKLAAQLLSEPVEPDAPLKSPQQVIAKIK